MGVRRRAWREWWRARLVCDDQDQEQDGREALVARDDPRKLSVVEMLLE